MPVLGKVFLVDLRSFEVFLEICPNKLPLSKAIVSHKSISQHILPQRDPWPCDTPLNNIGLPPRNRIESLLHTWFRVCKTTVCVFISANYVVECTPAILSTSRNQFMVMVLLYWPKTLIEITVIASQCENHTFRVTCGEKILRTPWSLVQKHSSKFCCFEVIKQWAKTCKNSKPSHCAGLL